MTRAPDSETRAPALSGGGTGARFGRGRHRRGRDAGPRRQTPWTSRDEKGESPGNRNASGFSGATPVSDRTVKQIVSTPEPGFHRFKAVYKHAINYSRGGAPVPPAGLAGTISGGISRMASLDERLMRRPAGPAACVSRLTARSAPPSASRGTSRSSQRRRPERTLRSRVRRKKGERSET